MAATTHTRQYDIEARSFARETRAGPLLFTGNFFPPESLGTNINLLFDFSSISLVMSPLQIRYLFLVEHLAWVDPNPGSIQVFTLRPELLYNSQNP